MQQIQTHADISENKKSNQNGRLFTCKVIPNNLADSVSHRWNQLYSSLLLVYQKLEELGLGELV